MSVSRNTRIARAAWLIVAVGELCAGTPGWAAPSCAASGMALPAVSGDARIGDLAHLLHGTWVRRLTINGASVQTNSLWYFDMTEPQAGRGQSMMIDRINQGADTLVPRPASLSAEPPATTGAYWSVSISPAQADAASHGHVGVMLALSGEYHGTGSDYPRGGFRFTETGTFYRRGTSYATLHPWHAPPQATPPSAAGVAASADTLVDSVVITDGTAATQAGGKAAPPTLVFVACQDGVVDRYVKIDSAVPVIDGKPLKAAWQSALASGLFDAVPAH